MSKNVLTTETLTPNLAHYCMTARYHKGDENGQSSAKFAALVLSDEAKAAGYEDVWLIFSRTAQCKESQSDVSCDESPAEVITGRSHTGDENGSTCYQFAKVAVLREKEDTPRLDACIATNFVTVKNDKESKAGWVESPGRVIIGRKHTGDENGTTVTTFAKIYIKNHATGETYPLELANEQTLGEQKESRSDFYVDSAGYNLLFEAWAAGAFGTEIMDHTWVNVPAENGCFSCAGGTDKEYYLENFRMPDDAYKIMDKCRQTDDDSLKDSAGIVYIQTGVCHQMANRFIYPLSGRVVEKNGSHPKCYRLSCLMYGTLGRKFDQWYQSEFEPALEECRGTVQNEFVSEYMDLMERMEDKDLAALKNATGSVFDDTGITLPSDVIEAEQKAWLEALDEIARKYGFLTGNGTLAVPDGLTEESVRAMVRDTKERAREFLAAVKEKIGEDNFRLLNDGDTEIHDIIDEETALKAFFG